MSKHLCGYNSFLQCLAILAGLGLFIFVASGLIVVFFGH